MLPGFFPQTFKHIFSYLQPQLQRSFWMMLGLTMLVACVELSVAGVVSLLGVVLASPQAIQTLPQVSALAEWCPALAPWLHDQRGLLVLILASVVCAVLLKNVSTAYLVWKQTYFANAVANELGSVLFRQMLQCSYLWHAEQGTPQVLAWLGWRNQISLYFTNMLTILAQVLIGVVMMGGIMIMAPVVGLIVAVTTGLCAFATYRFARKKATQYGQELANISVAEQAVVLPAIQGIRETLIYRLQDVLTTHYTKLLDQYAHYQARQAMFPPLPSWTLEIVGMTTLLMAVLYMNATDVPMGRLTGTLTLMAAAAWRLMPAVNKTVGAVINLRSSLAYVTGFMNAFHNTEQLARTHHVAQQACTFDREILFEKVSFRYPKAASDSLVNVSLTIPKGKMIGIVGTSGAGKSTLVALLTGLLTPTQGQILADGIELDPSRQAAWLAMVGYVPQTPYLLYGSIAQNVAYSQWGQPLDRKRILECCHMAAMDFLDDLPQGIDTIIGERGVRLSGGQAQRVSIARALYGRPQLLIFDEATSALDMKNEQAIHETVLSLRQHLTMIVIAHRLSTVQECDEVLWLDKGYVKMRGEPGEILRDYEQNTKMTHVNLSSNNKILN